MLRADEAVMCLKEMNHTPIITILLLANLVACTGDQARTKGEDPVPREEQSIEVPPAERSWPSLPEYTVHRRNPYWKGGEQGHIIVPKGKELSRDSLIQVLKLITEKEDFTLCTFYTNTDAYQANVSASFNSAHPGALERGSLGMVEQGNYTNVHE